MEDFDDLLTFSPTLQDTAEAVWDQGEDFGEFGEMDQMDIDFGNTDQAKGGDAVHMLQDLDDLMGTDKVEGGDAWMDEVAIDLGKGDEERVEVEETADLTEILVEEVQTITAVSHEAQEVLEDLPEDTFEDVLDVDAVEMLEQPAWKKEDDDDLDVFDDLVHADLHETLGDLGSRQTSPVVQSKPLHSIATVTMNTNPFDPPVSTFIEPPVEAKVLKQTSIAQKDAETKETLIVQEDVTREAAPAIQEEVLAGINPFDLPATPLSTKSPVETIVEVVPVTTNPFEQAPPTEEEDDDFNEFGGENDDEFAEFENAPVNIAPLVIETDTTSEEATIKQRRYSQLEVRRITLAVSGLTGQPSRQYRTFDNSQLSAEDILGASDNKLRTSVGIAMQRILLGDDVDDTEQDETDIAPLNEQAGETLYSLEELAKLPQEDSAFQWKRSHFRKGFLLALGVVEEPASKPEEVAVSPPVAPEPEAMLNPTTVAPKQEMTIDLQLAKEYAWIPEPNLRTLSARALNELKGQLHLLNQHASSQLAQARDQRERARLDSEMHHKVIECLVEHAQKRKEREAMLRSQKKSLKTRLTLIGGTMADRVRRSTSSQAQEPDKPNSNPPTPTTVNGRKMSM